MDKLVINLDEYQKISKSGRIFNILLGTAMIILPAIVIYRRISAGQGFWDYFFFVLLILLGLNILLYTFGIFYRISRRFVKLNSGGLEYKLSYFYPSRVINWEDLEKVEIKTLRIFFYTVKGSVYRMKLGEIFYTDIKNLKKMLASICSEKGITCTDTTVDSELMGSEKTMRLS